MDDHHGMHVTDACCNLPGDEGGRPLLQGPELLDVLLQIGACIGQHQRVGMYKHVQQLHNVFVSQLCQQENFVVKFPAGVPSVILLAFLVCGLRSEPLEHNNPVRCLVDRPLGDAEGAGTDVGEFDELRLRFGVDVSSAVQLKSLHGEPSMAQDQSTAGRRWGWQAQPFGNRA